MGKPSKLSRRKIIVIILIVLLLVVGAIALVIKSLNQPANGTIIKTTPTALTTPQPSYRSLNNKYFTARYSGRYELLPSSSASASLQSWTLTAHQEAGIGTQRKLSIVITALPTGGVTEDSAYKLYAAHPELYSLAGASYSGESVIVATRSDSGYQRTVLWPHKGYLLTVSLTTAAQTDLADSELQTLLSSLKWN